MERKYIVFGIVGCSLLIASLFLNLFADKQLEYSFTDAYIPSVVFFIFTKYFYALLSWPVMVGAVLSIVFLSLHQKRDLVYSAGIFIVIITSVAAFIQITNFILMMMTNSAAKNGGVITYVLATISILTAFSSYVLLAICAKEIKANNGVVEGNKSKSEDNNEIEKIENVQENS
ncbi:hypothetical protein SCHIN_v1c07810 [Spiroplasma chinense]|uniref:Uncharacterized protein n=1 Tax=Spiroplasma chinense TaxID=216932 RepID=A0A5B9Y5I1_9MOLU|nr:hypothetical protein [Spiroplasma chinense]QEH61976.1 hypothetical protein SCHIN_v1c07810 [Spiroplasma chinense]